MVNTKDLTDLQLVILLEKGNQSAFHELFNRYKAVLYSFCYYKVNSKEEAQDMIQSTFTQLWENRNHLNIPGSFESYIFTIVRNKIIDQYRRGKVSQKYLDNFRYYLDTIEDSTDHMVRHNDLRKLIDLEIEALPNLLKEAFLLSRNSFLTRKEIAEKLQLTEAGVRTRMSKALKILKKRLQYVMRYSKI